MSTGNSLLSRARRTLVGDRAFYRMVLLIVVPIIIQNTITNFVNLLDNIMVGRLGTDQMTGVSIVNQLMFVSNLCVFGGMSGAGIFAAQFHGADDPEGVRSCFRYKIWLSILLTVLAVGIFVLAGTPLISLYLNDGNAPEQVLSTLGYAQDYLWVMLWGIAPFALSQAYASTLREVGETSLPMRAGILAVLVNLVFNLLLIFGLMGFPKMGVRGAALATVISRYVELAYVAVSTHRHCDRYPFIFGVYRTLKIPMHLIRQITVKGMPLLVNEALWSMGVAMISRCYSLRGLSIVTASNISSTVSNLFNVVFLSMGSATAIILGQSLGAGDTRKAREESWKLLSFSLACSMIMAVLLSLCAPFIPKVYNTEESIRRLATQLLLISSLCMPLHSVANSGYFTLRSGGKTMITFVFDSGFSWVVSIPLAFVLSKYSAMPIALVLLCVQGADIIKCIFGVILLKKGVWVQNIVTEGNR